MHASGKYYIFNEAIHMHDDFGLLKLADWKLAFYRKNGGWYVLAETKQLYKWFSASVHLSVCMLICLSITPFSLCSPHCIMMKCPVFITIDRSDVRAKGHSQKSKVKVTEVKTNFAPIWLFPDHNSSLNSQMAMNWCIKLELVMERCPAVFKGHPSNFKVA